MEKYVKITMVFFFTETSKTRHFVLFYIVIILLSFFFKIKMINYIFYCEEGRVKIFKIVFSLTIFLFLLPNTTVVKPLTISLKFEDS